MSTTRVSLAGGGVDEGERAVALLAEFGQQLRPSQGDRDVTFAEDASTVRTGHGGIGWELVRATQRGRFDIAIGVTLIIFVLVMAAELFAEWLQRRSDIAATKATLGMRERET